LTKDQNRIGLVNDTAVWIHHVTNEAPFLLSAFIFDERRVALVNQWCA